MLPLGQSLSFQSGPYLERDWCVRKQTGSHEICPTCSKWRKIYHVYSVKQEKRTFLPYEVDDGLDKTDYRINMYSRMYTVLWSPNFSNCPLPFLFFFLLSMLLIVLRFRRVFGAASEAKGMDWALVKPSLILTTLWADSRDDKLIIFSYSPRK